MACFAMGEPSGITLSIPSARRAYADFAAREIRSFVSLGVSRLNIRWKTVLFAIAKPT